MYFLSFFKSSFTLLVMISVGMLHLQLLFDNNDKETSSLILFAIASLTDFSETINIFIWLNTFSYSSLTELFSLSTAPSYASACISSLMFSSISLVISSYFSVFTF